MRCQINRVLKGLGIVHTQTDAHHARFLVCDWRIVGWGSRSSGNLPEVFSMEGRDRAEHGRRGLVRYLAGEDMSRTSWFLSNGHPSPPRGYPGLMRCVENARARGAAQFRNRDGITPGRSDRLNGTTVWGVWKLRIMRSRVERFPFRFRITRWTREIGEISNRGLRLLLKRVDQFLPMVLNRVTRPSTRRTPLVEPIASRDALAHTTLLKSSQILVIRDLEGH